MANNYIKAIREQKAWEVAPKKSGSSAGFIAGVVGAFVGGLLLVLGLDGLPFLKGKLAPTALSAATENVAETPAKEAEASVETDARAVAAARPAVESELTIPTENRLGRPETSPLLLQCYAQLTRGQDMGKMKAADVYKLLKYGGRISRIATLSGAHAKNLDSQLIAYGWGLMADCIFKQNSWTMCEPRNRALAVESIREFTRQHRVALEEAPAAPPATARKRSRRRDSVKLNPHFLRQNIVSVHERTMTSFRHLLENGIIIAADFGYFPPSELSETLSSVKPKRDACATR